MALEERLLTIKPSSHISTTASNQAFYDEVVNGSVKSYAQNCLRLW